MDNRQRGPFRGGRGGPGAGSGRGGGRGGGNQGSYNRDQQQERKPREAILDLAKFMDKAITVKFNGGREGALLGSFDHSQGSQLADHSGSCWNIKGL